MTKSALTFADCETAARDYAGVEAAIRFLSDKGSRHACKDHHTGYIKEQGMNGMILIHQGMGNGPVRKNQ